jgi:hypothetical protein
MGQAADFFVSYTRADRAWAEWIAWQLEADGYRVVFQGWDFIPGYDWAHGMQHATTSAERLVAVLSAAYLRSVHGEAEWRVFYAKDPSGERGLLLPVRVSDIEPPGLLKTRIYADLVRRDAESARATLLTAARRVRGKPTYEPEFPGTVSRPMRHATEAPQFPGESESQLPIEARSSVRGYQHLAASSGSRQSALPQELLEDVNSEALPRRVEGVKELGRLLHAQPAEVAHQARALLQQLIDDDSRLVSQAAIRALSTRPKAYWTRGKVQLLHVELPYPGARALLDAVAEQAPRPVLLRDVSQRTGVRTEQISAELGAMTKLCKRLFGRDTWPLTVRSSSDGASYQMDPEIAQWWQQAGELDAKSTTSTSDIHLVPTRSVPSSTRGELRNRFFVQVLDRIAEQRPRFRRPTVRAQNYIRFGGGPFGHYAISFINDGRLRVGVLLEMQTADQTKRLFDLLVANRAEIEQGLSERLDWDRIDRSIRSWFGLHRPAPDLADEQRSTEIATWAADTMSKLMARLDARLRTEALRLLEAAVPTMTSPSSGTSTPDPESELPDLTPALEIATRVAADRQQRGVPLEFAAVQDAAAFRDRLQSALIERASVNGVIMGHVRPWVWTPASGGSALTEEGNRTGIEVRLSLYN